MKNTFICSPATFPIRTCLVTLLLVLLPTLADSAENVSAKYTRSNGSELVISITVASPAPASIILMQNLPPGVWVTHSQPPAKNVNKKKGRTKWLLREIKPGIRTVKMSLDQAVTAQDISATIRYKPANGGKMLTLPVQKQ